MGLTEAISQLKGPRISHALSSQSQALWADVDTSSH